MTNCDVCGIAILGGEKMIGTTVMCGVCYDHWKKYQQMEAEVV